MKNITRQQNNGFWTFKFCEKVLTFFLKPAGLFRLFYSAWSEKEHLLRKKLHVKWKQITYHTMQITVNQIMQSSWSNFKIIIVINYCENEKNNKGVPPPFHSPRLSVCSKYSRSEFYGNIFFRERLVMCSFYCIIT